MDHLRESPTFVQDGVSSPLTEPCASLPTVSVVVPAYNNEATIERALRSVDAQTYPNIIETIVIDDGSTDTTAEIVKTCFPRATYVYQDNAGPGAARNHAVRLAQGEYVAFLDADDFWLPHKTARQVEALLAHPAVAAVGARGIRVREGAPWQEWIARESKPGKDFWTFRTGEKIPIPLVSILVKRSAYLQVGGMDETLRRGQDVEFIMRLMATGYTLLALREVLVVQTLTHASRTQRIRQGLLAFPQWLGITDGLAPDATPPLGGILSWDEYTELTRVRSNRYAIAAMRFGAPAQAVPVLEQACKLPIAPAKKLSCLALLGAARVLSFLPPPFLATLRRVAALAADLRRRIGKPYWRSDWEI